METLMRTLISFTLVLTVAASLPAVAQTCPGTGACVASSCPAGATLVGPPHPRRIRMAVLQAAITLAAPGAVLCVQPSTYVGHLNFNGKPVTLISKTPLAAVLNGGGSGPVVTFTTFESPLSVLDGFTVTNGVNPNGGGGGILIVNASPTIKNCLITKNSAVASSSNTHPQGGGMYIGGDRSAPLISCTTFEGNNSNYIGGGAISTYLAHPHLVQDAFIGNTAAYGAGLAAEFSGLASIDQSEFSDNMATVDGGALHVLTPFGGIMARRTVLQGNKAGANGGGLWVAAGFATVLNSVFDGNSASDGGAAAAGFGSVLTVESTVLQDNVTTSPSGAALEGENISDGTVVINAYNLFYSNTGSANFVNTLSNLGILKPTTSPFASGGACPYIPLSGSPLLGAGMPDSHFDNPNGTPNDIGVFGGPNTP
jgi:hypothetical protein